VSKSKLATTLKTRRGGGEERGKGQQIERFGMSVFFYKNSNR